jgi:predicted Zn finger-like uncharacterized protein
MILQCDQCHTKFRLDDSKLKPGGVKVRCSKCRHVFLAGAETKAEESEFDAILSGLGAPVAKQESEVQPGSTEGDSGFGFAFDQEPQPAAASPHASEPVAPDEPFAAQPAAAPVPPSGSEVADFASFEFAGSDAAEPAGSQEPGSAVPAVDSSLDYGEFAFEEEPAPLQEDPPAAASQNLDFGDFAFSEEPPSAPEVPETPAAAPLDFGEFEFDAAPQPPAQQAPQGPAELDFGEFSFNEETPAAAPEVSATTPGGGLDFGEFSFDEEPPQPALQNEAADQEFDFGDFSSTEEPALPEPVAAAAEPEPFAFASALQSAQEKPAAEPGGEFSFEEFSFGQPGNVAAAAQPEPAGGPETASMPEAAKPAAPFTLSAAEPVHPAADSPADFDLGIVPPPTRQDEHFEIDEDLLPPLSISSRRRGRSLLTISVVVISVLVIVALSGAGLYLMQSGPAAFDKVGLGFVAKWFGVETPEEGRISIRNPQAAFYQNKEAGELFVVTGEAVNSFRKARASIHVKVSLFDKKGAVIMQKTAYCGNRLTPEQLATLPLAKIEAIMNNQFGDSLANLGVQPGEAIPFVVALANVPKEAADFGVEVIGSTVAGK